MCIRDRPSQVTPFCSTVTDVPAAEGAALESLFTDTNGWRWANRNGWLAGTQACQWQGVTCAGGHVTRLQLAANGLAGRLPDTIGRLTHLQALVLSNNTALAGPLPNTMTAVSYTHLDVYKRQGHVPLGRQFALLQFVHQARGQRQTRDFTPVIGGRSGFDHIDSSAVRASGLASIPGRCFNPPAAICQAWTAGTPCASPQFAKSHRRRIIRWQAAS